MRGGFVDIVFIGIVTVTPRDVCRPYSGPTLFLSTLRRASLDLETIQTLMIVKARLHMACRTVNDLVEKDSA